MTKRQVPPPPWPKIEFDEGQVPVAARPAPEPSPTVIPRLYFRETFPKVSGTVRPMHAPPALRLDLMEGAIIGPRRVLLRHEPAGVAAASFNQYGWYGHPQLDRRDGQFVPKVTEDFVDADIVGGPVYWADSPYSDIYGHLLLEVLPQLWAYEHVRDARVATSVPLSRTALTLFAAAGVPQERLLPLENCIAPAETLVPTMPLMLRDHVHPVAREMFERVGRLGRGSDAPTPEMLYVSRSKEGRRMLRNEAEVEAIFEEVGFAIYHPQEHPIEDQIRTFGGARFIAGPGGSAVHNAVFSPKLEKILILFSPAWFTMVDILLHQVDARLGVLFGEAADGEAAGPDRDWTIDTHQLRLAMRFHLGV